MHKIVTAALDVLRKPEWVAAIALFIQAFILWLQARILRKHGMTMEEHAQVAKEQAGTAALIGKALDEHAKILGLQARITENQFRFQRWLTAQSAREKVYDHLLRLFANVTQLISTVDSPGTRFPERIAEELGVEALVISALVPAEKSTLTCAHLTEDERKYFQTYVVELGSLLPAPEKNLPAILPKLKEIDKKYKDIVLRLARIAEPPPQDFLLSSEVTQSSASLSDSATLAADTRG